MLKLRPKDQTGELPMPFTRLRVAFGRKRAVGEFHQQHLLPYDDVNEPSVKKRLLKFLLFCCGSHFSAGEWSPEASTAISVDLVTQLREIHPPRTPLVP